MDEEEQRHRKELEEDLRHLKELLDNSRRRFWQLENQKARLGIHTPPEVHVEIEQIRTEIEQIRTRITEIEGQLPSRITKPDSTEGPVIGPLPPGSVRPNPPPVDTPKHPDIPNQPPPEGRVLNWLRQRQPALKANWQLLLAIVIFLIGILVILFRLSPKSSVPAEALTAIPSVFETSSPLGVSTQSSMLTPATAAPTTGAALVPSSTPKLSITSATMPPPSPATARTLATSTTALTSVPSTTPPPSPSRPSPPTHTASLTASLPPTEPPPTATILPITAAAPTLPATPLTGIIAFRCSRNGKDEICVTKPDGSMQTNLTQNIANDFSPAWSPDGRRIAFASDRDGNNEIYVMDVVGNQRTNPKRLTSNDKSDHSPTWSPDGQWIAFVSNRDTNTGYDPSTPTPSTCDNDDDIYKIRADGLGEPIPLTDNTVSAHSPAWSPKAPNGDEWIAFVRGCTGDWTIYKMKPDGSDLRNLGNNSGVRDEEPDWSPNGSQIAFVSNRDGNWEIYAMDADGLNQQRLTNNFDRDDKAPTWSPDGQWIAFYSNRDIEEDGRYDIYVMDANGTGPATRLTSDQGNVSPDWSP